MRNIIRFIDYDILASTHKKNGILSTSDLGMFWLSAGRKYVRHTDDEILRRDRQPRPSKSTHLCKGRNKKVTSPKETRNYDFKDRAKVSVSWIHHGPGLIRADLFRSQSHRSYGLPAGRKHIHLSDHEIPARSEQFSPRSFTERKKDDWSVIAIPT